MPAAAPVAAPACVVSGTVSFRNVRVRAPRAPEQSFAIEGFSATIAAGQRGATRLHVVSPLVFDATTSEPVPWAIAHDADLLSRTLHVSPSTRILRLVANATGLRADLELAPGVRVRNVSIPCELLSLALPATGALPESIEVGDLVPARRRLDVRATATGEVLVRVELSVTNAFAMQETARQGASVRVWHSFGTGAGIAGWVTASEVTPARAALSRDAPGEIIPPPQRPPCPDERAFRGRVAAGAPVYSSDDGAQWATVANSLEASLREEPDGWVAIRSVTGIRSPGRCPNITAHAFVHADAVTR